MHSKDINYLIRRRNELDAWLAKYRKAYNARRTKDEPSDEFFEKRSEQRELNRIIKQNQYRRKIS